MGKQKILLLGAVLLLALSGCRKKPEQTGELVYAPSLLSDGNLI